MKNSLCLLTTGLILLSANLQAQTTWYMTPSGTGTRNGTSWSNAFSGTSNVDLVNIISGTLQPGDTLLIGGSQQPWIDQQPITDSETIVNLPPTGQYYRDRRITLTGTAGGTPTASKYIIGVDRGYGLPVFFGTQKTRSYAGITLSSTCSYLSIQNIDFRRRDHAIHVSGTAHLGIHVKGNTAHDIAESAFYFRNCENLLIENCTVTRYNKFAFRFHYNCKSPVIRDCLADCTQGENDPTIHTGSNAYLNDWITKTASPIGFDFHEKNLAQPPNTDVLLERCVTRNNMGLVPSDYPQGDGFMVQRGNHGITFRKCLSDTARDAGYDLKGSGQTIDDSVAVNCRQAGVKVWYEGTFNNFIGVNNSSQFYIGASGTLPITVNKGTFHSGTSAQRGILIEEAGRPSTFNDCIISYAGPAGNYYKGNTTGYTPPTLVRTGTFSHAGSGTGAPHYANPVIPWDGVGANYDNLDYGATKGYNSMVTTTPPPPQVLRVISVNMASSSTNTLASTDVVGVVPAANWNNSTANNQLLTSLLDQDGTAVAGATAVFSTTPYSYTNSTVTQPAPLDDDSKMMRSHRAGSNTTSMTATVNGLTFPTYDVYVYWGGRTTGESVPATMTVELQLLNTGTYATSQTGYITDANRAWDGSYNESTATTSAAAVDGHEYVVFRNLTNPEFRLRASGPTRTGLSGFQVVGH